MRIKEFNTHKVLRRVSGNKMTFFFFFPFYQMANSMSILIVLMKSSQRLKRQSPKWTAILKSVWKGREKLSSVMLGWKAHRMLLQVHRCLRSKREQRPAWMLLTPAGSWRTQRDCVLTACDTRKAPWQDFIE